MIEYIQDNPGLFTPEVVAVKEVYSISPHINETHLVSVDVSKPVILEDDAWWDTMKNVNYKGLTIRDILSKVNKFVSYEYDFGDGWQHEIRLKPELLVQLFPCLMPYIILLFFIQSLVYPANDLKKPGFTYLPVILLQINIWKDKNTLPIDIVYFRFTRFYH